MKTYIYLKEVRFHAFHGVMPQEKSVGADFTISLRIRYDFSKAFKTDDVADTLNYAEIYNLVKEEMMKPSKLLEHVAGRIINRLLQTYPTIEGIDLTLNKDNPPMGADSQGAGVEIHI